MQNLADPADKATSLENLPSDLTRLIASSYLSFSTVTLMSQVSKSWNAAISHEDVGQGYLDYYKLKPKRGSSWLRIVKHFLMNTPYLIAIDVSASMMERSPNQPLPKIAPAIMHACRLAKQYAPAIQANGAYVMAFANDVVALRVYSTAEVAEFFNDHHQVGSGTNLKGLFEKIIKLQQRRESKSLHSPMRAFIISDFEDNSRVQQIFTNEQKYNVHFDCIQIGSSNEAAQFRSRFEEHMAKLKEEQNKGLKRKREQNDAAPQPNDSSVTFTLLEEEQMETEDKTQAPPTKRQKN